MNNLEDIQEYNILDAPAYDIRDMTIRFDVEYFLAIVGEKITEIGYFTNDILPNQSIRVNELKYEPDDKKFWIEVTVQEELKH